MIIVNDEYKDKYSQSGGGKEEDRAILLVYKQLTDRTEKSPEVIAHLTQQIFEYLRAKANEKLDVLFSQDPSNLSRFKGRVDYILSNYLEEEKEEEKGDFIGRINIISLQLILLFTFALEEIGKLQTDYGFKFIRVVMNILRNHNYLSYHKVKEYIISLKDFEVAKPDTSEMRVVKSLSLLWGPSHHYPESIFIIVGVEFFTTKDILDEMMENVFFLGLKFENNYADGFIEPPLGFLIHDILHGTMYLNNLIKHSVDKLDLKSFYDYFLMRKGSMDPVTFKKIMFMFFLLVHELYVNFFIQPDGSIPDKGMISHIIRGEYEDKPLSPITNSNFLGLLFPREIREMPNSNPDENTAKSTASWEYIMSAIDEYISLLERWHSSKQTAGRRKRRRTRNKRKGLRRKTRKNK